MVIFRNYMIMISSDRQILQKMSQLKRFTWVPEDFVAQLNQLEDLTIETNKKLSLSENWKLKKLQLRLTYFERGHSSRDHIRDLPNLINLHELKIALEDSDFGIPDWHESLAAISRKLSNFEFFSIENYPLNENDIFNFVKYANNLKKKKCIFTNLG